LQNRSQHGHCLNAVSCAGVLAAILQKIRQWNSFFVPLSFFMFL